MSEPSSIETPPEPAGGAGRLIWVGLVLGIVAIGGLWWLLPGDSPVESAPNPRFAIPDPDTSALDPRVGELIANARRSVQDAPGSVDAWAQLSGVCDAHGLDDCASAGYRRSRELAPGDFRWPYLLAIVNERQAGPTNKRLELYRQATALQPDFAPAQVRLGQTLLIDGRHAEASEAFRRALEVDPDLAMARRDLGRTLLELGDAEAALAELDAAAASVPGDRATLVALAQAHDALGHEAEAAEANDKAGSAGDTISLSDPLRDQVAMFGSDEFQYQSRVRELMEQGDFLGAAEILTGLAEQEPDNPNYPYGIAICYLRLGERETALKHLEHSVELDDGFREGHTELGMLLTTMDRLDEAIEHFRAAVAAESEDPLAHAQLGEALARSGDLAGAAEAFLTADSLGSLNASAYGNWGTVLLMQGRAAEAVGPFQQAVALRGDDPHVHLKLGFALEQSGRGEEAADHYRTVQTIDPNYPIDQRRAQLAGGMQGSSGR